MAGPQKLVVITTTMLTFGMGASTQALFARVGGGIYTKAADVGADLVGKVEAGIPEDDPRNPATIADNVGDNVGDVAGMGADLYESYVGSILATFALSAAANYGWSGMLLPVALAVCGIVCSLIGSFLIKTKEDATQMSLLKSLRTGTYTAAALSAVLALPLSYLILGPEQHCWGVYVAILCGLIGGCAIGYFTEYYTSDNYKPTQQLAAASETGSATIIIGGISLGLKSTMASILIVSVAILLSYFCAGGTTTIIDASGAFTAEFNQGLYGIGIAAVGMLSTLGITLETDAYGPVADNAGGIAEMAGLDPEVRKRTDALDSLGNTTAAIGKGFAIGSAALTALALFVSYAQAVGIGDAGINILDSRVTIGLLIGGMLPFVFSALTMDSVSKAAYSMIEEVRRQFRTIPGIMEGTGKPDYKSCVAISTTAALKEMLVPGVMAVLAPLVVGLLLGTGALGGMLAGALVTGVLQCVLFPRSGLLGASGIVFMLIMLSSLAGFSGGIPVTMLLVAALYFGQQVYDIIFVHDNVATVSYTHLTLPTKLEV